MMRNVQSLSITLMMNSENNFIHLFKNIQVKTE